MIRYKHPIEYELTPETLEKGNRWLTLRLKNEGEDDLQNLDIKMHPRDSFHISFINPSDHIYILKPDEERKRIQVNADGTTEIYVTINGLKMDITSTGTRLGYARRS